MRAQRRFDGASDFGVDRPVTTPSISNRSFAIASSRANERWPPLPNFTVRPMMPLIILTNIERRRLKESLRFSRHFPETRGSWRNLWRTWNKFPAWYRCAGGLINFLDLTK